MVRKKIEVQTIAKGSKLSEWPWPPFFPPYSELRLLWHWEITLAAMVAAAAADPCGGSGGKGVDGRQRAPAAVRMTAGLFKVG